MKRAFSAAAVTALAGAMVLPAPAEAQDRPNCRTTRAEDMPNSERLLARAYDCVERGFTSSLLSAADEVEKGYKGDAPDWRRAAEAYEFIVRRNDGRTYGTMAFINWTSSLGLLSSNYETGVAHSGWPMDLVLARAYQARIVDRMQADGAADPGWTSRERDRLFELDAKLALQRQRSGRWSGDIPALSRLNRFSRPDSDLGVTHLRAGGFVGVLTEIEPVDVDPGDDQHYVIRADVYMTQPLQRPFVGLCLVLGNGNESGNLPGRRAGIFYKSTRLPPDDKVPIGSGPFKGWFSVITTESYRPIRWSPNLVPNAVSYEFRPVTDKRLCPADI